MTPRDYGLLARGERCSAIAAMSVEGLLDVHRAEGTVNGSKFEEFVRSSLIPIANPSIVVMDNASIHHVVQSPGLLLSEFTLLLYAI